MNERERLWHLNWMPKRFMYDKSYNNKTMRNYSRKIAKKFLPEICICGSTEKIQVHHKNRIWWDLRVEKLQWLCRRCHWEEHKLEQLPILQTAFEGHKHTKEYKIKMRQLAKGWWNTATEEMIISRKNKLSDIMKRRYAMGYLPPNLGKITPEKTRKLISKRLKGHIVSEDTKKKMSDSGKLKIFTAEHRLHMSLARKGKKFSEEHKIKIGESRLKYFKIRGEEKRCQQKRGVLCGSDGNDATSVPSPDILGDIRDTDTEKLGSGKGK